MPTDAQVGVPPLRATFAGVSYVHSISGHVALFSTVDFNFFGRVRLEKRAADRKVCGNRRTTFLSLHPAALLISNFEVGAASLMVRPSVQKREPHPSV